MQNIDIERALLWLIETRDPNLYKFIQSRKYTFVEGDSIRQAKILAEEFLIEINDPNIDQSLDYKKTDLELYELTKEKKLALLQHKMIDIFGEHNQREFLEIEGLPLQDRIIQELERFIYHNYNWNPTIISEMDFDWSEELTTKFIWAVQLLGEYNQITDQNLSWTQILEGK